MRVETIVSVSNPKEEFVKRSLPDAGVVFYFLSPEYPQKEAYLKALKESYPFARLIGCTTGGEIAGDEALNKAAVSAAVKLEHSQIKVTQERVTDIAASFDAGKKLAQALSAPDLRLIFVLSDGLLVNGSELVNGIVKHAPTDTVITGGLAGDGANFKRTGVGVDVAPEPGVVAAIGFYGKQFRVSYGSVGGWQKFGPERMITRSKKNMLYELDEKPALDLYKKYLGEEANNLPGSGLLFPLSIRPAQQSQHDIVRTIVGINEQDKSLIFAGDVPTGYVAQLMCGNNENLTEGATKAAQFALKKLGGPDSTDSLAILVSCIGRNLLMGQRVSDEVEAVKQILTKASLVGFYSYGEICHHPSTHQCDLHNQTMTITLFSEAA